MIRREKGGVVAVSRRRGGRAVAGMADVTVVSWLRVGSGGGEEGTEGDALVDTNIRDTLDWRD